MSLAVVLSRGLAGLDAPLVTVEVHLGGGLPAFNLVGLPETEVRESRDRVRAALQNGQFEFPARKITVNLAPADLPKESGRFDLPIALGILAATGQLPNEPLTQHEFAGELALTGALRPIRGALAMTLGARRDGRAFVLPAASAAEAALVRDAIVYPAASLLSVCAHIAGRERITLLAASLPLNGYNGAALPDLAEVRGQSQAKRALTIAAAGAHSLLILGPSKPSESDRWQLVVMQVNVPRNADTWPSITARRRIASVQSRRLAPARGQGIARPRRGRTADARFEFPAREIAVQSCTNGKTELWRNPPAGWRKRP